MKPTFSLHSLISSGLHIDGDVKSLKCAKQKVITFEDLSKEVDIDHLSIFFIKFCTEEELKRFLTFVMEEVVKLFDLESLIEDSVFEIKNSLVGSFNKDMLFRNVNVLLFIGGLSSICFSDYKDEFRRTLEYLIRVEDSYINDVIRKCIVDFF